MWSSDLKPRPNTSMGRTLGSAVKRLLLPKAFCSNFLRQFEDTPERRFSFLNCGVKITRESFIPAAITADCPIYT